MIRKALLALSAAVVAATTMEASATILARNWPFELRQLRSAEPVIVQVPANEAPPVPSGLKVACTSGPDTGAPSKTCPVVQYKDTITWVYSFMDNREAMELVTYDGENTVVKAVTLNGARYVWQMTASAPAKSVTIFGQANHVVAAPWTDFEP